MNLDLNLQIKPRTSDSIVASYTCPCGCSPRLGYDKGSATQTDDCCCGNQFAVGPGASAAFVTSSARRELVTFDAPWGGVLEAAWKLEMLGSQGDETHDHGHDHGHGGDGGGDHPTSALDPVCGMTVDKVSATARDLVAEHEGTTYYFCGRGCKLEFGDDPGRFLDPSYVPSM